MQRRSPRLLIALFPVFAAIIIASCGDNGTVSGPNVASLVYVSGNSQSGPIGSPLAQPLVVRTEDQNHNPVSGASVTWELVSGDATLSATSALTGSNGQASVTLTLGSTVGPVTVRAEFGTSQIAFSLTAVAAAPSRITIVGGSGQNGTVGAELASALVVRVSDALDNPSAGFLVTFSVTAGAGTLSAATGLTDASGVASVTWTLGTAAGSQSVTAAGSALPTVTFVANARPDVAAQVIILSGNGVTGPPGTTVLDSVRVLDRFNNPIPGATVTWVPGLTSGSANPGSNVTDANGRAGTTWTLGLVGGPMTLVATSGAAAATFNGGATVNFASLGAGGRNSCGVTTANVLFCWGYNGEGQLGIGEASGGSGSVFALPQPSAATGNLAFQQVVASLYHACAITLSGVGYCWGINMDGRLGNNTEAPSDEPVQVFTPVSFQSVSVSRNHTCGLSFANRVFCWGYALDGQIGNGIPLGTDSTPPADFLAIPTEADSAGTLGLRYSALTSGGLHSCAITTPVLGSAAYCWGVDQSGQLGNGAVGQSFAYYSPKPVIGGLTFTAITAGYTHTCALAPGGIPWCWGGNATGQLGDGSTTLRTAPTLVSGGHAFTAISAGMSHTCAVTAAGAVWCWGRNASGQLGDGTTIDKNFPVVIAAPAGQVFVAVSAGDLHTCAVTTTNIAYCWGNNQYGQIGDGTQTNRLGPTKVAFQP